MAFEVEISSDGPEPVRLRADSRAAGGVRAGPEEARRLLDGRVVWNVNSTAQGGGVVELLRPLVALRARRRGRRPLARDRGHAGVLHDHQAHPQPPARLRGRRRPAGRGARGASTSRCWTRTSTEVADRVREGDVVIVHDPQPAGMLEAFRAAGAARDLALPRRRRTSRTTSCARPGRSCVPTSPPAEVYVFSREAFVWEGLDRDRVAVIPPSIDVFSPKNVDLDPDTVRAVLQASGLVAGGDEAESPRSSDTTARRAASSGAPSWSRSSPWARTCRSCSRSRAGTPLKDPLGVIRGFAEHVPADDRAHIWSMPRRPSRRSPTTRRACRCCARRSRCGSACRRRRAAASTSRPSRWRTRRRTRSW